MSQEARRESYTRTAKFEQQSYLSFKEKLSKELVALQAFWMLHFHRWQLPTDTDCRTRRRYIQTGTGEEF